MNQQFDYVPAGAPMGHPATIPTRPATPKTMGILSIIFGSIGILFNGLSSCGGCVGSQMGKLGGEFADRFDSPMGSGFMEAIADMYQVIGLVGVLMLGMSVWLLVLGIGQVRYRRWAAQGAVVWGTVALVVLAIVVTVFLAVVGPAYEKLFEAMAEMGEESLQIMSSMSSIAQMAGGTWAVLYLIFYGPYPVLNIIFFRKPDIRACMQG